LTNKSILEELKLKCRFVAEVKRRKLQYFGHVVRADNLWCAHMFYIASDIEEDHGDVGQMTSNNGQEYSPL